MTDVLTNYAQRDTAFRAGTDMAGAYQDEWLTPPRILQALGPFDLDPCAPVVRSWDMAAQHYTVQDNGLKHPWSGRVWCNPPYGADAAAWIRRLAEHGNGVALIFARTETALWHTWIWPMAHGVLFLRGRLQFFKVDGTPGKSAAGAPSVLVAYGLGNLNALRCSGLAGHVVELR